jgi:NAD(P)-dependent dehydrogenase (short-subunit alcohol dehydrogenase family)
MSRVAIVTGATQGLGAALVAALAGRLQEEDVVYLTGRDRARIDAAAAALPRGGAEVRTELLDVASDDAVEATAAALAARHGRVDVVICNAYRRVLPGDDAAAVIADYVNTNNYGTTRMLRAFAPLLADGASLLVVASTLGTLHYLAPVLHGRFDGARSLEEIDAATGDWCHAVQDGSALAQAWPAFINIPSKVAQVGAVRALASERRADDLGRGILLAAVCPGMIDTGASRPWFDMRGAQTPEQAAGPVVDVALGDGDRAAMYGELVRFGAVLPWTP